MVIRKLDSLSNIERPSVENTSEQPTPSIKQTSAGIGEAKDSFEQQSNSDLMWETLITLARGSMQEMIKSKELKENNLSTEGTNRKKNSSEDD